MSALQRRNRGRGRAWTTLLAAVLGLAAALAAATPAAALRPHTAGSQRYDVWSCQGPDGAPAGASDWMLATVGVAGGDVQASDDCASGGPLTLTLAANTSFGAGARASWRLQAPRGTHLDSWEVDYEAATVLGGYGATVAARSGAAIAGEAGCRTSDPQPCAQGSAATPAQAGETGAPVRDALELQVGCAVLGCPPAPSAPARLALHAARVEVHDLRAPDLPQLSGPLLGSEPVAGATTLVIDASDSGGGVAKTTVAIDGGAEQVRAPAGAGGACREPYTLLQPCPSATAHVHTIDTTTLADGPHSAAGTVVDAAGNTTRWGPVAFVVKQPASGGDDDGRTGGGDDGGRTGDGGRTPGGDDGGRTGGDRTGGGDTGGDGGGQIAPPPGNGLPAVRRPRLKLDRARLTRRGARAVRLRGTLRTAAGQPIAGARLTVASRQLGVSRQSRDGLSEVTTNGSGRFAVRLKGRGAARVTVAFAPADGAADTVRATATVRERASLSIARSRARLRRGGAVVLRGRLRGTGPAARGAVVELQAIVRGGWRTVGTARADARGRYAWRYRFVSVTRDTIFTFRAVVRRTPGWAWPELRTRRIDVRVDAVR